MNYDPITGIITNKFGKTLKSKDKDGYIIVRFEKRQIPAHRVGWFLLFGTWPNNQLDHINGIKDDNRLSNLREVTPRENQQNRLSHRNGRLPGTTYFKRINKWVAQTSIDSKQYHIGCFDTEKQAHEAYVNFLKEKT